MSSWDCCVEQAKDELGVYGYVDRYKWVEVIYLAKQKYWKGDTFKELKRDTINSANEKCQICHKNVRLTAHHITYGKDESTICVCKNCHEIVHSPEISRYGFVLQCYLLSIVSNFEIPDNFTEMANKVAVKIYDKLDELDKKDDTNKKSSIYLKRLGI